jgi:Uma2 family endonuclease
MNHDFPPGRVVLDFSAVPMTEDQFVLFCRRNDPYRIEREPDGSLLVMEPSGFEYGSRELDFGVALVLWNRRSRLGRAAGPSAGYTLPNGAVRAPDASWISHERLAATTEEDREKFVHAVPEFVIEVRSRTDRPADLRAKMREYLANGVRLGWYVDLKAQTVEIFRADGSVERVKGFEGALSGEDVLPGFVFDLGWLK